MKFAARLKLVQAAQADGVKATARRFGVSLKTLRKWYHRHQQSTARSALLDRSRRPHHCPHQTPPELAKLVLQARGPPSAFCASTA